MKVCRSGGVGSWGPSSGMVRLPGMPGRGGGVRLAAVRELLRVDGLDDGRGSSYGSADPFDDEAGGAP